MVWIDVSPTESLINEEYIALEVIGNTKGLSKELGFDPWQSYTDGTPLEEVLWTEFRGRWMEIAGKLPRLGRKYFDEIVETLIPKPGMTLHFSFTGMLDKITMTWIDKQLEEGHKPMHDKYIKHFLEKGVWKKALYDHESFYGLVDIIETAREGWTGT